MLKFYITLEEQKQAQKRADELDVSHSNPPGQHPYVWENWRGCAKRWYNSASAEGKIGTIWFKPVLEKDGRLSQMVPIFVSPPPAHPFGRRLEGFGSKSLSLLLHQYPYGSDQLGRRCP